MIAKRQLESTRFHAIVHLGWCSVQIHVLNVHGREACLFECQRDRAGWFLRGIAHSYAMKGLACGRVSHDLRVNTSAACAGMLVIFENKHPRTFRNDKAIAISRERPRSPL